MRDFFRFRITKAMQKLFVIILIAIGGLSACKKYTPSGSVPVGIPTTTNITTGATAYDSLKYDTAYANWQVFKKSATNGYTFTILMPYTETPVKNAETTITVINNVVIARDFTTYNYSVGGVKVVAEHWSEDKTTINTHPGETWFLTMDDVYSRAKNEWLNVDPQKNTIYFDAKNSGLISTAGYFPNGCQDDCFIGLHIISITAL